MFRTRTCLPVLAIALGACGFDPGCGNHLLQRAVSPDGRRQAVVYVRDCGATAEASTQVSVLPAARRVVGRGNVFIADAGHRPEVAGPEYGPRVWLRWVDRRTVEVRYDPRARIFLQETRHDETNLRFVPDSSRGPGV